MCQNGSLLSVIFHPHTLHCVCVCVTRRPVIETYHIGRPHNYQTKTIEYWQANHHNKNNYTLHLTQRISHALVPRLHLTPSVLKCAPLFVFNPDFIYLLTIIRFVLLLRALIVVLQKNIFNYKYSRIQYICVNINLLHSGLPRPKILAETSSAWSALCLCMLGVD